MPPFYYLCTTMIILNDIHKSYNRPAQGSRRESASGGTRSHEVLRGITLTIADSRITAILGPSGAGKSTLLNIIGTLERPDSGSLRYDDIDPFALSDSRLSAWRCQNLGFIFQSHRLLPELTIEENIALPALIAGTSRSKALERARSLAASLGIDPLLSAHSTTLSGGENQRAAIARALINDPRILLCDEPTGNLDSGARSHLGDTLRHLCDERGVTILLVTHDPDFAAAADVTINLCDGVAEL